MGWGRRTLTIAGALALAAGAMAAPARGDDDGGATAARAWGWNLRGTLGLPDVETSTTTPTVVPGVPALAEIDSGWRIGIARTTEGRVLTVGENDDWGMGLGDPEAPPRRTFAPVEGLPVVRAVELSWESAAAIDLDGGLWVWGTQVGVNNDAGGTDASPGGAVPVLVQGLPPVASVAAGSAHWAVMDVHGGVWTWGLNGMGALGHGDLDGRAAPERIQSLSQVKAVASGAETSFAILADGTVVGWGDGRDGLLARPGIEMSTVPVDIPLPRPATTVSAGIAHACASLDDGSVWCWGRNVERQIGDPYVDADVVIEPRQVTELRDRRPLADVVSVSAGAWHTVALDADGVAWTWGAGAVSGRIDDPWPGQVPGLGAVSFLRAGMYGTFAIDAVSPPPDVTAPESAVTTRGDTVLTRLRGDAVTGTSSDDASGLEAVTVTYTSAATGATTDVAASLACDERGRSCTWTAALPPTPGVYRISGAAQDRAGNVGTFDGPRTVIV